MSHADAGSSSGGALASGNMVIEPASNPSHFVDGLVNLLHASAWPACILSHDSLQEAFGLRHLVLHQPSLVTPRLHETRLDNQNTSELLPPKVASHYQHGHIKQATEIQTPMERFSMHSPDITSSSANDYFTAMAGSSTRTAQVQNAHTASPSLDATSIGGRMSPRTVPELPPPTIAQPTTPAALAESHFGLSSQNLLDKSLLYVNNAFVRMCRRKSDSFRTSANSDRLRRDMEDLTASRGKRGSREGVQDEDDDMYDEDDEFAARKRLANLTSRNGSDPDARGWTSSLGANFSFLSQQDQDDLLSFVLDFCETSDDSSQYGPTPCAIQLESIAFSATVVAPKSVVLQAVPPVAPPAYRNKLTPRPENPGLSSMTLASTNKSASTADTILDDSKEEEHDDYLIMLGKTPMGRMIREYNWAETELGPISGWCPELRTILSSVLASPNRECILWGPNRIMLYNDEYVTCAMGKHPGLLGKAAASDEGWAEIWDDLEPVAQRVMQGETVNFEEHFLPMIRQGYTEETYHTFSYQPFYDARGRALGIRNLSIDVQDFADMAMESISHNPYDVPFCAMYTVTPATTTGSGEQKKRQVRAQNEDKIRLGVSVNYAGSLGIPEDHPFFVRQVLVDLSPPMSRNSSTSGSCSTTTLNDVDTSSSHWSWPFEDACLRKEPVFVDSLGLHAMTLEQRGWEEQPRSAVVIPIFVDAAQTIPQAIMVLGINPRSSYNDLYATFLKLLARHIAVGLFAVMAKTSFFNNVSHELRTPLTLILGPLEDVINSKDPAQADNREKLKLVQRHANRLLGLVNKLLDFSSLEGGRMQVKFRPVQLGYITRDLATLFRDTVERNGLQFVVNCDDDPPDCMPMYTALDLWDKIVFNLIGNAVKYCPSGSIVVTLKSTLAGAVFSVKDTGVGIPQEDLTRIFERFTRVDSTARTTSGTGIGLALTLEIVKLLGGQLEVESEIGKGSTFSVHLPRGFIHLPIEQVSHEPDTTTMAMPTGRKLAVMEEMSTWRPEERERDRSESLSLSSVNGDSESGSGEEFMDSARGLLSLTNRTILVVEDSPDLSSYITSILAKSFNVVQMPDGLAGLEYALKHPPHLIVTDQMMPRMNGHELVAALRSNSSTALLPIIMISAQAGSEARAEALERGLDDYLCKPFQARELLARVNVHLQLGLMRVELEKRVEERTSALIKSEAQNRALADKFSTLSAVSPVGILQADAEGNIVYANPRFYDITGHPRDQPLSEWRKCVWDEDQAKLDHYHAIAISGQSNAADWESLEIRFKNREDGWGQFDVRPFREIDGRTGFVAAVTDISRQKKAEALHVQTLEARRHEADENRRNTEAFLDMSSHELRNPLSGVWQNAELLASSLENVLGVIESLCAGKHVDPHTLDDVRRELIEDSDSVESILICASHQGRIADDILNVSKLNMGLLSIVPVPFDLVTRMKEVLRMTEAEALQKNITLRSSVSPTLERLGANWIVADPSRLAQILLNFLSNSIKYTAEAAERQIVVRLDAYDGPPPNSLSATRISQPQSLELKPGQAWISVGCQDSGKGLSSDELKKLFARFSQANPRSDQYGGSGLGLWISKRLVERHGGFIEVESSPGAGSTFRFMIPAQIATPPAEPTQLPSLPPISMVPLSRSKRARPANPRQPSVKNPKLSETTNSPVHVLVVEDNLINQKVMTRQLKLAGYHVTVANNGREGLDYLIAERQKPHNPMPIRACLMDIEMPVMGGLEAIRLLREMERRAEVPHYNVIAVTGNARKAQIDTCREAGFDEVMVKPYNVTELLAQIAKFEKQF
ncbi:hypothetical protein OIV83_005475 [Microbotryomycetes sp. JL201]|nr:hypothetical protein OIV83_005475 [Microbotryomycetes sp. JL201]